MKKFLYRLTFAAIFVLGACSRSASDDGTRRFELSEDACLKCGPSTDEFFAEDKVATLRLSFSEKELAAAGYEADEHMELLWERWNSHCGPYDFTDVRVEYESPDGEGDVVMEHVGMRLRGGKSRGVNPLTGFKLDMSKLISKDEDRRRFADLNRIEILSNEGDDSSMLQCASYKMIREFGGDAPRCNHIKVYMNGEYYGLMENVERAKDARFLRHHFDTNQGPLFGGSVSCGYADALADLKYKGDDFQSTEYLEAYEQLRGDTAAANISLIPMLKCGDEEETPDDDDFRACIQDWIDVDQWLKLVVAETLMPSIENMVGSRRNFYLYFHPDSDAPHDGRMKIWGWDYDTGFQKASCFPTNCDPFSSVAGWYGPRGKRPELVTRLTTVFRGRYCKLLNEFLDDVYKPDKIDELAEIIEPYMDDNPIISRDDWDSEIEVMKNFILQSSDNARMMIDQQCEGVEVEGLKGE